MKTCNKCGETKPTTEYHKDAKARDGLRNLCKCCANNARSSYRVANLDKEKARGAAWYEANRDKASAANAAWRAANQDKEIARGAARYALSPCKEKARNAAWYKANPDANRIKCQNRRARKHANGGLLSPGLADKLFKLQRGKCACCRISIEGGGHLDHVIPLALDGPNEDWNMQLLCGPCNQSKHAKHPVDFMQSRGFLL